MENASKALLIAGGMLLAILLVTLLVYAWGMFSEYQNAKADLAEIEDTAKFNEQLSQYDRDDVDGYTLLSLINRIVDYNERNEEGDAVGAGNGAFISGTGNNFTAFFNVTGSTDGISTKTAVVISGTKSRKR